MNLIGTAKGANVREVIKDAQEQAKTYYGTTKHELIIGTATLETEKAWGGEVLTQTFEAEFEATPKEVIL
ncbi:hypothetical protein ACTXJU_03620 [Glutamicibacter ardleyensis]|uniref:hypothetical protein n=1 Tax=Glutamicibacter ardleyensis TaxID=225894 RepID=UPI003FD56704